MKARTIPITGAAAVMVLLAILAAAKRSGVLLAQNSKSTPSTAERTQLPTPEPAFKGKIGETYKDSLQDFPQPLKAPEGAPNVVVILLDDVGLGQPSTFGGPVPTPQLDRLASQASHRSGPLQAVRDGHGPFSAYSREICRC